MKEFFLPKRKVEVPEKRLRVDSATLDFCSGNVVLMFVTGEMLRLDGQDLKVVLESLMHMALSHEELESATIEDELKEKEEESEKV